MTAKDRNVTLLAIMLFLLSSAIRIPLAFYSSGSDIPQFAGFADTFRASGLCFYVEGSNPQGEPWPYPWLFPYGPLFLLVLYLIRLLAPAKIITYIKNNTYYVKVPFQWIVAIKTVFVIFDSLIVLIIFYIAKKRTGMKSAIILSLFYILNPMAIYNSTIYGMFDHIALFFFLLSLVYLDSARISGIFAGLSIVTKPTFLFPYIGLLIYYLVAKGEKIALRWFLYSLLLPLLLIIPFVDTCPQTIQAFIYTISWRGEASYKLPLVYTVNGVTALATYLHLYKDLNTIFIIRSLWLVLAVGAIMSTIATLRTKDPFMTSFLWYLSFMLGFWGDNPQFLVTLIGLGILALVSNSVNKKVIIPTLLLSSIWPLFYPLDFWFNVHVIKTNNFAREIARHLTIYVPSDYGYTMYFLALYISEVLSLLVVFINSLRSNISRR